MQMWSACRAGRMPGYTFCAFVITAALIPYYGYANASDTKTLLIAPHISGQTFCSKAIDDPHVNDEEAAALVCTSDGQNSADRINGLLDAIGPAVSPSGNYELGYTLNLPLMRFYHKAASGWVLDEGAIANAVSIIRDVRRPVVVYLSANHFTDGGIALSDELAKDKRNLMWTKAGPLQPYNYFAIGLHAWTLSDMQAPVTVLRRQAFGAVLKALCNLDQSARSRVAALSVLGEVHELWKNFDAGQGYNVGFDTTDYSPKAVEGFHTFLTEKFKNIGGLNQWAGSNFQRFGDVPAPRKDIQKEHLNSFFEHIDAFAAGTVAIQGWAFDPSGDPVHIAIYLDGKPLGAIMANLNRSDVAEAVPDVTTANVGWRYDLDYHSLANGIHTLEVFTIRADGRKVRLTKRGLVVVPRDQSDSKPVQAIAVDALESDPGSKVRAYIDGPAPMTPLFYNPVAKLWLQYRNKAVADYIASFADMADKSCFSSQKVFSHQIMPELNSSWDGDLMAVEASQGENRTYNQGATLYNGAAWGQAFFDWKNAHGWKTYAVSEMHPRFAGTLTQFEDMLDAHRQGGARFVAPYFLSIAPRRLIRDATAGLNKMLISPDNHQLGSDVFYNALADTMRHH